MAIEVRIPTILRTYTGGAKAVEANGRHPARAVIDDLETRPPRPQGPAGRRRRRPAPVRQRLRQRRGRPLHRRPGHRGQGRRHGDHPARRSRRRLTPSAMARYDSLLDSVGDTPLVGLPRLSPSPGRAAVGQARGPQPDRVDQGPRRARDGRGRRRRTACCSPGCTILEPTSRQHRHLAGHGRPATRLQADLRHAGEHLDRAAPAAARCAAPRSSPRPPPAARTRRSRVAKGSPRSTPTG